MQPGHLAPRTPPGAGRGGGGGVLLPSQVPEARKQVFSLFDHNESSAAEAACSPDSRGNSSASLFYSRATPWQLLWVEVFGKADRFRGCGGSPF